MNSNAKSLGALLKAKYDGYTQVEKIIADFFMSNEDETADFSSRAISERLFVSEASLSRFVQKCGFPGYREFIYQYKEYLRQNKKNLLKDRRRVLNVYQELLNEFYSSVDEAQIIRVVKYLNDVNRVIACGKGSSGLAAHEMEIRFMRIGLNIDSLQDTDRMLMQAVFLNKENLVCGMSISGKTEEVIYLLKESYKRGAKTILITANNDETYHEFCTEVMLVPALKYLNQGNLISPQYPLLIMIDLIYSYYIEKDIYQKNRLHDNTLWALEEGKGKRLEL